MSERTCIHWFALALAGAGPGGRLEPGTESAACMHKAQVLEPSAAALLQAVSVSWLKRGGAGALTAVPTTCC